MSDDPSWFKGAKRPVENVSWGDCQAFLAAFNRQLPELTLTLPTEAQWEYAYRAGTATMRYDEDLDSIAWYGENSGDETHDVGLKQPNAWGLYDMLGNVWEWCQDYPDDQLRVAVESDGVTEAGGHRVVRGGSWGGAAEVVQAVHRDAISPDFRYSRLGFRCLSSS